MLGAADRDGNPFAKLGLKSSRERRDTQPPTQADAARFVALAGELDAFRWQKIDFQAGTILVDEQWNVKTRQFTLPKHSVVRTIALTDPARKRLLALPRESDFVFTTLRGSHYRVPAGTIGAVVWLTSAQVSSGRLRFSWGAAASPT